MKLTTDTYVIMKVGTKEDKLNKEVRTGYLKYEPGDAIFVDAIGEATHFDYTAALRVIYDYEYNLKKQLDWKIVPLTITYEW